MPGDYSDVGQAVVLAREYADTLQFTTATDFLHYDGVCWNESDEQALAVVQELTDRQLQEAETAERAAWQKLKQSGGSDVLVGSGAAKEKKLSMQHNWQPLPNMRSQRNIKRSSLSVAIPSI